MTGPRRKGVRPFLSQRRGLTVFGLDVSYGRAEGSRLWHADSEERPVWDFLGGYGSTFFGHNHPELTRAAIAFLERPGVIHGQASVRPESERLAATLARRLHETDLYGLGHSTSSDDLMYPVALGRTDFSAREKLLMNLMLQRRPGNQFPDNDRSLQAAAAGSSTSTIYCPLD